MGIGSQTPFFEQLVPVIQTEDGVGISYVGNTEQTFLPFHRGRVFPREQGGVYSGEPSFHARSSTADRVHCRSR